MPRNPRNTNIDVLVTPEEYTVLLMLADSAPLSRYLRALIAEDAQRVGIEWPDNLRKLSKKK